jgi:sec-independent protein translocase protein TatC
MPFLDHLEELRRRIFIALGALVVCVGAAFALLQRYDVIGWLERPIIPYLHGHKLVFSHPGAGFQIILTASVCCGLLIALPIILYQVWAFLRPALYPHERRVAMMAIFGATVLFAAGVALAYLVVLPLAIPWLLGFGAESLEPLISASEYFDFVFSLVIAFGVAFELPIVLLAGTALGIITPQLLSRFRRHAIVGSVIVGAFLTPGDLVWTTIAMAVPLYLLYELSVILSYMIYRRRQRRETLNASTAT